MKKYLLSIFTISFFCIFLCQAQSIMLEPHNEFVSLNATNSKTPTILSSSPYELSLKKELPIYSIGLGLKLAGLHVMKKIEPLTVADIEVLVSTDINSFDRRTIENYSGKAQATSDILLFSSLAYPLTLMADERMRKDFAKIGMMATQALLLNTGVTTLTKGTVKRTRPYVYNPDVPIETKFAKTSRMSFFSGHTSTVSVMSFFTAKIYADYYPESNWKPVIWTIAATLPAATAYLRYKGGKHFPTDVIVGYGVGAAIGILVPHFHKKKKKKGFQLLPLATNDAVGFSLTATF